MGPLSREAWAQRLGAFRASPSAFLAGAEGEDLGRDLLSDLRSEKLSEQTKVSLLTLSLEYSDKLWPDAPAAEAAATSLLDTLVLLTSKPSALRRLLLLAATTALVSGGALGPTSGASCRLLPLLLGLASGRDMGRSFGTTSEQRHLQATACECLGELERSLKAAFGEALFTAQDEVLLLRRLTLVAQHPALPTPTHLLYLHCLLSFPENCPLGPEGEEAAPLLLGPQLCRGLMPSLLHDPMVLLARLHLLCLLCADAEQEERGQVQSPQRYLQELLAGLQQRAALDDGPQALATLCFQASYLIASCLAGQPTVRTSLIHGLARLYRARPSLAPHFGDLLDQVSPELREPLRVVLHQEVVARPGKKQSLRWHLRMLAKVAEGGAQSATLSFLQAAAIHCADWGPQQALLRVCRALLRTGGGDGLADLLQVLARQLEDADGRDHARLYYILFSHLSSPKLGMALGPSLAAPALASSLVAENQGFASTLMVQETPAPIQLSVGPQKAKGPPLVLHLQVGALEVPVYSLELRFRVEGQLYEPLEAVHIPCLCPGRPTHRCLPLKPRCPVPTRLHVQALYTTSAGLTCHAHLPPLSVNFDDLFLPFPQLPKGSEQRFFDDLWNSCLPKGVESRLWCPLGPQGLDALVSRHLESFVMVARPPTTYLIAVRLPPDSMLLLRLETAQVDGVPVALRTDNWTVLPLAGDYLRGLAAR
ncbi:AP-5 complex subunit beta-1 isoform X2 [Onychomys torridus]|uniref:AP-5 complex subunit beta-1 isoform X2 n=1 Tax=Onychomys torridus TaxID=38674 RepID=UPI00167F30A0|nr:AP-5 complex subunit beta-1 isoform X2 [Onychomys torridus]